MEQVQLYKRLFALTLDDLTGFIPPDEDMTGTMLKLNTAARTRLVLEHIQFEDMWQLQNAETGEYEVFLEFSLAPDVLVASFSVQANLNELIWQWVLPKPDKIPGPVGARCFASYLDVALRLEILDPENYDVEDACAALDLAYDFAEHS